MFDFFYDLISYGGLPLLFILILLEGNPIVGSFIPGQILAVFFGVLVSSTDFYSLFAVLLIVFIAGFLSDILGYFLGSKYGNKILRIFKISKSSPVYSSSKIFFDKFGVFSIILGRQFNLTRAFIPFLAGTCNMKFPKFLIFALISNILWSFLSVFLGYYFGLMILDKLEFVFEFIIFLIVYFIILSFFYKKFKKFNKSQSFLIEKYALYSIISSFIAFLTFILFLFLSKTNFPLILNSYFYFLPQFNFYSLDKFLSFKFLLLAFFLLFGLTLYFRNIKLFIIYIWGVIVTFIGTFILGILIAGFFPIKIYYSIIFVTVFLFFFWVLIREEIKIVKYRKLFHFLIIFLMFFFLFLKLFVYANFYILFISFFLGLLLCEILVIMSHFNLIDKKLSISCNLKH